ncbi:MAG TPA: hypothetical protein VMT30_02215 [Candidatus Saccharimonadia bacterium]|nr:hypothetical protein [Candidatus Saccharimonadia bacterium]
MTKKLAVPPVHPDAVLMPAVVVPASWEDAFAMMSDRMARIIGRQAADIQGLKSDLVDARGLTVAAAKGIADLGIQIAGLAAAFEIQDTATKAQAHRGVETSTAVIEIAAAVSELVTKIDTGAAAMGALVERVTGLEVHEQDHDAALAEAVQKVADAVERADQVAGMATLMDAAFGKLTTQVDQIAGKVEASDAAAARARVFGDELADAVEAVRREVQANALAIEDYAATASGEDAALTARLDEVANAVNVIVGEAPAMALASQELAAHVDDLVTMVASVQTARAADWSTLEEDFADVRGLLAEATTELAAVRRRQGEDGVRVGAVEEAIAGFVSGAAALAREVRTIDETVKTGVAAIGAVEDQSRDALRRVTIALDQMPAGFMIDQEGKLNRVNRAGDMTSLGTVVGHAKDGRDGVSPAQIVAIRADGERLVMTLSDRSEVGCPFPRAVEPAPPAPSSDVVDPLCLGYLSKDVKVRAVQVDHMARLRADGKNFKEIAELFAISERQAARLIKGHNDEKSSHT